jgi:class I fructose-bisphosphate aldolase
VNTGKLVRLNRIFAHPSGRLCSVAVDHFAGYDAGLPAGLRSMAKTIEALVGGGPDAITMHRGIAATFWQPWAGRIPLIMQSSMLRLDDSALSQAATPEDAVRVGADAFAVVGFMRGPTEGHYLRVIAESVREAARFEMPVICHIYPRTYAGGKVDVSFAPEDIAWAAHCAIECGVDVVKVPYCGDVKAYAQIVADCPVRLVAAGGPKTKDLRGALALMAEVRAAGAAGATIGRNIWGFDRISDSVRAFKAVLHDGLSADDALRSAGL